MVARCVIGDYLAGGIGMGCSAFLKALLCWCWSKHRSIARSIKVLPAPVRVGTSTVDLTPMASIFSILHLGVCASYLWLSLDKLSVGCRCYTDYTGLQPLSFFFCISFIMPFFESAACKGSLNSTAGGSGRASR